MALGVPLSAVTSLSARQGVVNVLSNDQRTSRKVSLGERWDGWIEIKGGLSEDEVVAVAGHEDLQPQEKFNATAAIN